MTRAGVRQAVSHVAFRVVCLLIIGAPLCLAVGTEAAGSEAKEPAKPARPLDVWYVATPHEIVDRPHLVVRHQVLPGPPPAFHRRLRDSAAASPRESPIRPGPCQ